MNEYCDSHSFAWIAVNPAQVIESAIGAINRENNPDETRIGGLYIVGAIVVIFFWVMTVISAINASRKPYQRISQIVGALILPCIYIFIYFVVT